MPPIHLNRRRFLGCSAAAGFALAQGQVSEAATPPIRLGLIGVGNRGTSLLRSALEIPAFHVLAVADLEPRNRQRGQGIVEKATRARPDATSDYHDLLTRPDLDALLVALPCDLHAPVYEAALLAGKHLYAEKPLALTLPECDRLIALASSKPNLSVHVGFQRRSNPRFQEGIARLQSGEIGDLLECRALWTSSNGPVNGQHGWLALRERSGDFMLEQAVHIWDLLLWLKDAPPARAFGGGRRDVFAHLQPDRNVTDWYSVQLEWPDGFRASFTQSWVDPADDAFTGNTQRILGTLGGFDFSSGVLTYRDRSQPRQTIHPGHLPETNLALEAFARAIRAENPLPPPVSLASARDATQLGLLVRRAVDERRVAEWDEVG